MTRGEGKEKGRGGEKGGKGKGRTPIALEGPPLLFGQIEPCKEPKINIVRYPYAPLPKGAQKPQCPKCEKSCDNSETVRDGCQLLWITNRKSHTGFRLIPTSMTLNDLELYNSPQFALFSPNSVALLAIYVTVVEDGPIMSAKYCLPVPVFHFWPKLTHPAARSLCDSWATC